MAGPGDGRQVVAGGAGGGEHGVDELVARHPARARRLDEQPARLERAPGRASSTARTPAGRRRRSPAGTRTTAGRRRRRRSAGRAGPGRPSRRRRRRPRRRGGTPRRPAGRVFSAMLRTAVASAGALWSTLVTAVAPPAAACTENPPVQANTSSTRAPLGHRGRRSARLSRWSRKCPVFWPCTTSASNSSPSSRNGTGSSGSRPTSAATGRRRRRGGRGAARRPSGATSSIETRRRRRRGAAATPRV